MELVKYRLLVCFLTTLCSCAGPSPGNNKEAGGVRSHDGLRSKPPATFLDTATISIPAAVFYNPDSLQLRKIKAVTDTAIFASMVHDCFYQMRNAKMVLKKSYPHVKIIEVKNIRYILFNKAGGKKEIIDLNTKNDPCGLFIFDAVKSPRLTDMTNINTDLGFYFSK